MKSEQMDRIVDLAATLASRADEIDQVLIIYRNKSGGEDVIQGSLDNELSLKDALWLAQGFVTWLTLAATGLLPRKGN